MERSELREMRRLQQDVLALGASGVSLEQASDFLNPSGPVSEAEIYSPPDEEGAANAPMPQAPADPSPEPQAEAIAEAKAKAAEAAAKVTAVKEEMIDDFIARVGCSAPVCGRHPPQQGWCAVRVPSRWCVEASETESAEQADQDQEP